MKSTLNISIILKLSKSNAFGLVPIYARLTLNGERTEINTGVKIQITNWDNRLQRIKADSPNAIYNNNILEQLRTKAYVVFQSFQESEKPVSVQLIKQKLLGIERQDTLLSLTQTHLDYMIARKDLFALGTIKNYKTSLKCLRAFIEEVFLTKDLPLDKIGVTLWSQFEQYLISNHEQCNNNGRQKYFQRLKATLNFGVRQGILKVNPLDKIRSKMIKLNQELLSLADFQKMDTKILPKNLDVVRDGFMFSCYTGVAHTDLRELTLNNIVKSITGNTLLCYYRQKTRIQAQIPLPDPALELVKKYQDHPVRENEGLLFPTISNQKTNQYLKDIAKKAELQHTSLHFHLARHFFGTFLIGNGVSLEVIKKEMGHSNLKTTELYTSLNTNRIELEMKQVNQKFNQISSFKSQNYGS
ncbi:site-specific integrase [bacterium AH-315-C07]|nr:site-specific integrase [bacterium AH-315-C07]